MPDDSYINPETGKFNSSMRLNLRWNGTTQTRTFAGKCTPDSVADRLGFDWIIETLGTKLDDKSPGPRLFLAWADNSYVMAVQPNPDVMACQTIAIHSKFINALKAYRAYRTDLAARYKTGAGRPVTRNGR